MFLQRRKITYNQDYNGNKDKKTNNCKLLSTVVEQCELKIVELLPYKLRLSNK